MSETKTEIKTRVEVPNDAQILTNGNSLNGEHKKVQCNGLTRKRKNQFGDHDDDYMTVETWRKRWRKGQTKFHLEKVHPILQKHYSWLTKEEEKQRFFLPLCGKSLDLKWLVDKGHVVVGNECSAEGVKQFFDEHDLEYTVEPIEDISGDIHQAKNLDVTIYCCDFFLITPEIIGTFDAVWDRGSLAAIHPEDRKKYADVFFPLLKKDGRCLLDLFQVDHEHFAGPPHTFPPEELQTLLGKHLQVELVNTRDALTSWQKEWGVAYFIQNDYYITHKTEEVPNKEECEH
ncbi:thiopurine S-methyltransferase-like [Saccoglossus kowalevskii]|uniref:Thiopurine S-methyltransferase-like n=1 Tax=Saccoglossus kowalevskii TaxID=10224 RepID=A0ABM0MYT6_SACKO|nr:PREDICTED: thiopurine S-methyltransferase-like [Saccoglossus kowalevskii]